MEQPINQSRIKLEIALEEVCRSMPHGGDHGLRKQVAQKLLDCASDGTATLAALMDVARRALADATRKSA
jgi:hypothetical protein